MLPRLQDCKNLLANEPDRILISLDRLPDEDKLKIFPNYKEYVESNPDNIMPLIKNGIDNDEIIDSDEYAGIYYNKLGYTDLWNSIALIYMNTRMYEKSRELLRHKIKNKAYDSITITNCAASILNIFLSKHKIEKNDEPDFEYAKKLLFDAFNFDVQAKPRKNIANAALLPAFKNIVLVRNIESELHYNKQEYFLSFIIGWISIEMSLVRIWCKIMSDQGGERNIREKLSKWDIQHILDALLMLKVLPKTLYSQIKGIKEERNKLIHGTLMIPTPGLTDQTIKLGRALIPIQNP